jgi:NAD(P)-dependent dehydrogenase (short-subunit alcohol dehydrogenase family)
MDPFRDRVAVVTGGAAGIGRGLASAFAARGAKLVLADIDEPALAAAEKEFAAEGVRVLAVATDVREPASVANLAEATWRAFGGAHVVCNNAGIAPVGRTLDASLADWETTMAINFWGVVHGVNAFLPRMLEQGEGGHIVNTASMAGMVGMLGLSLYCASKFAVVGLTESLHRELANENVGVSALCPMIVETSIGEHSRRMLDGAVPPEGAAAPTAALRGDVITVAEVAKRVVTGIERKDLYIYTHPEQREILKRRAARQEAMFETERWDT